MREYKSTRRHTHTHIHTRGICIITQVHPQRPLCELMTKNEGKRPKKNSFLVHAWERNIYHLNSFSPVKQKLWSREKTHSRWRKRIESNPFYLWGRGRNISGAKIIRIILQLMGMGKAPKSSKFLVFLTLISGNTVVGSMFLWRSSINRNIQNANRS